MNVRKKLNPPRTDNAKIGNEDEKKARERDLVDLGDARAETRGSAGGALDLPITNGHY